MLGGFSVSKLIRIYINYYLPSKIFLPPLCTTRSDWPMILRISSCTVLADFSLISGRFSVLQSDFSSVNIFYIRRNPTLNPVISTQPDMYFLRKIKSPFIFPFPPPIYNLASLLYFPVLYGPNN